MDPPDALACSSLVTSLYLARPERKVARSQPSGSFPYSTRRTVGMPDLLVSYSASPGQEAVDATLGFWHHIYATGIIYIRYLSARV